jgi:uncharacterized membrane protein
VGTYFASGRHGFLLSKGNFTTIDVPGASDTFANGINPKGDIVGTYFQSCFPCSTHGFLLSNGVFTTIDFPGALSNTVIVGTLLNGINAEGDIVGYYASVKIGSIDVHTHGFLLSKGVFTTIDFPLGGDTQARGINLEGDIVGTYGFSGLPVIHGFLLSKGVFTTIDLPGALLQTIPSGINPGGDIVGTYSLSVNLVQHGFLLSK